MKKKSVDHHNSEIEDPSELYKVIEETGKCNNILGTTYVATLIDDTPSEQQDEKNEYFSIFITNEIFSRNENHLKWTEKAKKMITNKNHPNAQQILSFSTNGQMVLPISQDELFDSFLDVQKPMIVSEFFQNSDQFEKEDSNLLSKLYSTLDINSPYNSLLYVTLHDLIDFKKSHFLFSTTNKQMLIYGIVSAMKFLHQNEICHHELTPSNILIQINSMQKVEYHQDKSDNNNDDKYCFQSDFIDVKVCNFESSIVNMSHLSNYPLIRESLPYYAPETLQNGIFDKMTDIYSFGIVLYQILTNDAHPYSELENKEAEIKVKVPAGYRPSIFISVPFQFQNIIDSCVNQDPEKRPSFERLADLLVTERYILKGCDIERYTNFFNKINEIESHLEVYSGENFIVSDESVSDDNEEEDMNNNPITKREIALFDGKNNEEEDGNDNDDDDDDDDKKDDSQLLIKTKPSKYIKLKDLIRNNNEIKSVGAALENTFASNIDFDDLTIYQFNNEDLLNNTESVSVILKDNKSTISNEDKQLLKKSLEGDPSSCYLIYKKLITGEDGFPKKIDEAVIFLKYAADHNDEKALFDYANILIKGELVPHDYLSAFYYFKKSGELYENDISLVKIGMFLESQGKLKEAKEYYKKSMDKGNLDALCHYAYILEKESTSLSMSLSLIPSPRKDRKKNRDKFVDDYEEACKMYQDAAEKGNILGLYHYERIHHDDSIPYDPKLLIQYAKHIEQINPKKASLIYKRVADSGNSDAQVGYGLMLEKGIGVGKPNPELAFFYYENSAKENNSYGNYHCARALQNGIGTRKNLQLACDYYEKAAALGNADAMNSYGKLAEAGVVRRAKLSSSVDHLSSQNDNLNNNLQEDLPNSKIKKSDVDEAAQYFKMSADSGNAEGMVNYARFLELGCAPSVPKNLSESAKFYKMAADHGNADGMYNIARMLQGGIGITKDLKSAFTYFQKASETGNARAMNSTGFMLHKGFGTERNDEEAIKYFKMGAKAGSPVSMNNYAEMLEKGEGNRENRKNEAKALKYYKRAAEMNDPNAMNNYARFLERGIHVTKNIELAIEFFKKSASQRNPDGMYNYARMLEFVTHDKEKAVEFYEKAANMRNTRAMIRYADILDSLNDNKNNETILKFYKLAADAGDLECMKKVAHIYEKGRENVPKDLSQSARYYKKASENGSIPSMYKYACMLRDGEGVLKNLNESKLLFKKAADLGDSNSMLDYGLLIEKDEKSNIDEITRYFYHAAKSGKKAIAYYNYGRILELRSNNFVNPVSIDKHLVFNSKEELMREAAEMYKIAADKGNPDAMFNYALCLSEGKGVEKNLIDSYKYFNGASSVGNIGAITHAGIALKDGVGVRKDLEEARKLLKKGAEGGDPVSMTHYALILIEDNNIEEAKALLFKAAELNEKSSYYHIAKLFEKENNNEYIKYYKLSADDAKNMKAMKKYAELTNNIEEKIKYYEFLINTYNSASNLSSSSSILSPTIDPKNYYEALCSLGKIYLDLNKKDKALKCFKEALQGQSIEVYYNYAKLVDDESEKYKYYKLCADYNSNVKVDSQSSSSELILSSLNSINNNNNQNIGLQSTLSDEIKCDSAYEYAMYMKDKKVASEFEKYIKTAADLGNLKAIIEYSKYLEKNSQIEESEKYVKIAADKGDIDSILNYAGYSEAAKNELESNKYYKIAAEQNSPKGLYKYGKIQERKEKYKEAMAFYQKSADLNYSDALIGIGHLNERGYGIHRDSKKAFQCYQKAAELGNAEAMWKCGEMLEENDSNFPEAFKYYKMSAENHSMQGMLHYARFLIEGLGTPNGKKDELLALHYYKELAHLGNTNSMRISATILMKSDDENDKKEAVQFLKAASDLGDVDSMYLFGHILNEGLENVVQKNERMAAKLLRKSAIGGNSDAMYEYSDLLYKGSSSIIMKNESESIRFLKRSADHGNIRAILRYVEILRQGNKQEECLTYLRSLSSRLDDSENEKEEKIKVKVNSIIADISEEMQNHAEAARIYKQNADKNNDMQSMLNFARMALHGTGIEQNSRLAAEYYKKAADLGSVDGMLEYAKLSQRGYGDHKDRGDAFEYIEKAAETTTEKEAAFDNASNFSSNSSAMNSVTNSTISSLNSNMSSTGPSTFNPNTLSSGPSTFNPSMSSSVSPSTFNTYSPLFNSTDVRAASEFNLESSHPHNGHHLRTHSHSHHFKHDHDHGRKKRKLSNDNPMTLMSLGRALSSGFFDLGNPHELSEAAEYFKKAADLGNADAMYHYAKMRSKGIGIEQDYSEAFEYFMKSREQSRSNRQNNNNNNSGSAEANKQPQGAQFASSSAAFLTSNYTAVSDDCGIKATRKAAKMLLEGIGVQKDVKEAASLFKEAAEEGQDLYSMYAYASILVKDENVKDKDERRQNIQKAAQYFKLAAQNGIVDAAVEYGKILENGLGGYEKNIDSAVNFYFIAAKAENPEALYLIGHLYETGIGLDKSPKEAKNYYLKAAEKGNQQAMLRIAHFYKKGKGGLQKSKQQALLYYQKAADLGNVEAMMKYASLRKKQGDPATTNLNDAMAYYEKAASLGSPKAKLKLIKLEKKIKTKVKKEMNKDGKPPQIPKKS